MKNETVHDVSGECLKNYHMLAMDDAIMLTAQTAYSKGYKRATAEAFDAAINEVSNWMILSQKAHEQGGFSNPKEAEREHGNTMRLLSCIQASILKRAGRGDEALQRIKDKIKARAAGGEK